MPYTIRWYRNKEDEICLRLPMSEIIGWMFIMETANKDWTFALGDLIRVNPSREDSRVSSYFSYCNFTD